MPVLPLIPGFPVLRAMKISLSYMPELSLLIPSHLIMFPLTHSLIAKPQGDEAESRLCTWSHADPEQTAGMQGGGADLVGLLGPVVANGAGEAGGTARQNSALEHKDSMLFRPDATGRAGNGSYTEAAKLRSPNSLRTATGVYTGCKYLEDPVRVAGVTLGSSGFPQEGATAGPASLHGTWLRGRLLQNLPGVAFTVKREHRFIKKALDNT